MTETMLMPVVPTSDRTIAHRAMLDSAYALTAFVLALPAFVLVVAGVSREREVMERMAEGRSNASIADALTVTLGAVEKHTQRIFAKLDLAPDDDTAHRRVLAVVRFLRAAG